MGLSLVRPFLAASNKSKTNRPPNKVGAAIFRLKVIVFQIKRAVLDLVRRQARYEIVAKTTESNSVLAESITLLRAGTDASEMHLVVGKINNLRIAIRHLNKVQVPAGQIFSFWKQIGRPSRLKGYCVGRELREGCIIPNIGGGLCQLSNALYDAALKSGFEIIERHAHTQVIPGSLAEIGRDATVFWNYVDLRFRSTVSFRIEATLTRDNLVVRFVGEPANQKTTPRPSALQLSVIGNGPHSCGSCGVNSCFRNYSAAEINAGFGRTAFLVDKYSREFDGYIGSVRTDKDVFCLPLDGKRFRKSNYAWSTVGFAKVKESRLVSFLRSYRSRELAQQGAQRQLNLLKFHEALAKSYAAKLIYDVTHVVVMQNLLPYLWRDGHLGGRTFDVLMTSLPMSNIHERLDLAFQIHPESKTLGDFRADEELIRLENEALKNARNIITPHTEIASLFEDKAIQIDWEIPEVVRSPHSPRSGKPKIVFPGPTAGRKGAFELREALKDLSVELITVGADLEGEGFWQGMSATRAQYGATLFETADLVVLPAFVEHNPAILLKAVAHGIPVIASTACGLENVDGVINVPVGDITSLKASIEKVIRRRRFSAVA